MNTRNLVVVTLSITSGVLIARLLPTMEKAARGEADSKRTTLAVATADEAEKSDLESRLVAALKDTWSMHVQDGKFHMTEISPPGLQAEGGEFIFYGFCGHCASAFDCRSYRIWAALPGSL